MFLLILVTNKSNLFLSATLPQNLFADVAMEFSIVTAAITQNSLVVALSNNTTRVRLGIISRVENTYSRDSY